MKIELIVALIAGAVAFASGGLSIWGQSYSSRLAAELENLRQAENARLTHEKSIFRYREPLGRAAYDLQSRLYNILEQKLISIYYDAGSDRERLYVLDNTVFLAAQYFAWTEIIRRDIQYLDLGTDDKTRQLAELQDRIYSLWQTDDYGPLFRVFAGEQRAIGERMIRDTPRGPECIGYGTFLNEIHSHEDQLLSALKTDVHNLSTRLREARARLVALQNAMIDLLDFLDPNYIRFPKDRRTKVAS